MTTLSLTYTPGDLEQEGLSLPLRKTRITKLTINVIGALNRHTSVHFHETLNPEMHHGVFIFDLEQLDEIDGTGLGAILTSMQCLMLKGKKVKILNINGQPRELLIYLGLDTIFGRVK